MEYRRLGTTGTKVSVLSLGTWRYGEATDEKDGIRIIHRALDSGINFVDTANIYPDVKPGTSEEIVGKALAEDGRRQRTVLATKVHNPMGDDVNDRGNSRRHIMQAVEASLRRLQTDYIDLYYLHRPDADTPFDEELMAMDDLIRQGKVVYGGTSHYAAWQMCRSRWIASERNLHPFVVDQPGYSLIRRGIETEIMQFASEMGVGLVPHSPLYQGILTGKYHGDKKPEDARGVARDESLLRKAEQATPVVEKLLEVAKRYDKSADQVAIRWVLQKPAVSATVIGPRTVEQLDRNLGSVDWQLSAEDMTALDDVAEGF
ncbi:MAG: aldo/keto reductase [Spirochaetia bacterium]